MGTYTDLYSGSKRLILQAGTRSGVVEEFHRVMKSSYPDCRVELKDAVPLEDGWYQIRLLFVPNLDNGIRKSMFLVRSNTSGLDILEV